MAGEIESCVEETSCGVSLRQIRDRVRQYIDKHQYESAVFWADKAVSLSTGAVDDVYWYAQSLYLTGQYHRASHLLRSRKLDKSHAECRYLAARCHYKCKEWQVALNVLNLNENNTANSKLFLGKSLSQNVVETDRSSSAQNIESSINLLRGKIYEAMDNRILATDYYREALNQDIYCFEAFDRLVAHHMLSAEEEKHLLESLPYNNQCPVEERELVKFLYENRLKKYNKPGQVEIPPQLDILSTNLDVEVNLAERHYYNCDFRECYNITHGVLKKDPYNSLCLPLHIAVLVELKKSNELFYLSHKLVDLYPSKPVAWFSVGCYYLLINNYEPARRYLTKATTLDRMYGPAWLAYGHSFAVDQEHDQAMAAYFTASQLMKGCHLPVLYIGLEYGLTNNSKLAERFFSQALTIAPEDPFVLHEMGVIAFQNQDYMTAEQYFLDALEKVRCVSNQITIEKWETLHNNLGHTCRKLKKYKEALQYHEYALTLCPLTPSTYSAIGYVYVLMGQSLKAVDYFHKALGIRRDDSFSTTMLQQVFDVLIAETTPFGDIPNDVPSLELVECPSSQPKFSLSSDTDEVDMEGSSDG